MFSSPLRPSNPENPQNLKTLINQEIATVKKKGIRLVASCGFLPRSPSHPPHRRSAHHRCSFRRRLLSILPSGQGRSSPARSKAFHRARPTLTTDAIPRMQASYERRHKGRIAEFKELKNPLVIQKTDLEQKIVALEASKAKRLEPLRNWILEANKAENAVNSDNWLEMKSFLQKTGSNRLLRAQTLTVTFKKPFDSLAETVLAVRDLPDEPSRCSRWWRRRELNPRPKSTNQPRLHAYSR